MKILRIFLLLLLMFPLLLRAQSSLLPVDTVKNLPAIRLIDGILKGETTDPLWGRISVFGNPDCHRCVELHDSLVAAKVDFDEYDLRDRKLMNKLFELLTKDQTTETLNFSFPVVIFRGKVSYNIQKFSEFIKTL